MWENTDKELKSFSNKFHKENKNTLDEFQNIFNGIENMDGNASETELNWFKRRIHNHYEYLSDYGKYKANRYLKMRRIKKRDLFWFDLFMIYAYQQYKALQLEMTLFNNVAQDIYKTTRKELGDIAKKKINVDDIVNKAINSPNSKGYIWQVYNDTNTEYNVNELYNLCINRLRQNKPLNVNDKAFKKLFNKQNKRLISINGNKISGALDNETIYIANTVKLECYDEYNIQKCKFIAVEDKVTTKMCKSLDGQIFNVHDWNTFKRYSATNEAMVRLRVYGMIPGVNLPPIQDSFHYCRSTITYILDKDVEEDTRRKLTERANKNERK